MKLNLELARSLFQDEVKTKCRNLAGISRNLFRISACYTSNCNLEMAGVLARIKKFFKRKAEEEIDDRDDTAVS